jgi:dTDP-4-dehydrorhamnose 3,5-epimerase-like enzyme
MKTYQAGERIPYSGVYKVIHNHHMHSHEVTCISGELFPACAECRTQVRFTLLSAAHSIKKHAMFADEVSSAPA